VHRRTTRLAVALLSFSLLVAGGALAAPAPRAPLPALEALVPSAAEVGPGTKVTGQRVQKLAGVNALMRLYAGKHGGAVVLAMPMADGSTAATNFGVFRTEVGLRTGRATFARAFGGSFLQGTSGSDVKIERTVVGPPTKLGPNAFRFAATLKTNRGTARIAFAVVQVDRVLDIVALFFRDAVAPDTVNGVTGALTKRLRKAFTVENTAPPAISGTPAQGRALKLDEGVWAGAPSEFAYAWSRCDATGHACAPIPGATARTYVPGAADSGSTLRATVTGSNTVSSDTASSGPTSVVG
jgi:hypothetical protein